MHLFASVSNTTSNWCLYYELQVLLHAIKFILWLQNYVNLLTISFLQTCAISFIIVFFHLKSSFANKCNFFQNCLLSSKIFLCKQLVSRYIASLVLNMALFLALLFRESKANLLRRSLTFWKLTAVKSLLLRRQPKRKQQGSIRTFYHWLLLCISWPRNTVFR